MSGLVGCIRLKMKHSWYQTLCPGACHFDNTFFPLCSLASQAKLPKGLASVLHSPQPISEMPTEHVLGVQMSRLWAEEHLSCSYLPVQMFA